MAGYNHVRQLAEERQLGSLIGTYSRPGFGKYLAATGGVCLVVFILFAYSGALRWGQGWLCLSLMATGPIFICLLAFLARNWGVYEYSQGFILNEGRDTKAVAWDDIVSLEQPTGITTTLGSTGHITTYTAWLKHQSGVMLSSDYQGISHLIATIETKLAEAKPEFDLSYDKAPILAV